MLKKTNLVVLIVAIALAAGLVAAASLLGTKTWNPGWNPFGRSSNQVIEKTLTKTFGSDSFKTEGNVKISFQKGASQTEEEKTYNLSLSFSQSLNKKDIENSQVLTELDLILGIEGISFNLKAETISIGNDVYLRVTSIPALSVLSGLGLEKIKGQWYKVEAAELEKATGGKEIKKAEEKKILGDLGKLVKGKKIFQIKKNFGEESVKGEKTNHYKVALSKNFAKEFIPEFLQIMKKYVPESQKAEYEKNLSLSMKNFSQNFEEGWKKVSPLEFDIWSNGLVRRVKFEKKLEYSSTKNAGPDKLNISADLYFSDFGKKFKIEAPKNYKPIDELIPQGLLLPQM